MHWIWVEYGRIKTDCRIGLTSTYSYILYALPVFGKMHYITEHCMGWKNCVLFKLICSYSDKLYCEPIKSFQKVDATAMNCKKKKHTFPSLNGWLCYKHVLFHLIFIKFTVITSCINVPFFGWWYVILSICFFIISGAWL